MNKKSKTKNADVDVVNDFRPAPTGWQVLRFELFQDTDIAEEHITRFPMAGWIVRRHSIIPAYWENQDGFGMPGQLLEVETEADQRGFCYVLVAPGEETTLHELNQQFNGYWYDQKMVAPIGEDSAAANSTASNSTASAELV